MAAKEALAQLTAPSTAGRGWLKGGMMARDNGATG